MLRFRRTIACWLVPLALTAPTSAAEAPLVCFGDEPSWSVDLTAPGTARVTIPDKDPATYRGGAIRNEPLRESIWRGTSDAGQDLVVFLRDTVCSDGMSDVEHPVTVRASLPDGSFLAGCCRAPSGRRSRERPATSSPVTSSG